MQFKQFKQLYLTIKKLKLKTVLPFYRGWSFLNEVLLV